MIAAVLLVLHDHQVSVLLEVLDFRADEVLVALDPDDRDAVVAHVADDLHYELFELLLFLRLVLLDEGSFLAEVASALLGLLVLLVHASIFELVWRFLTLRRHFTAGAVLQSTGTGFDISLIITLIISAHFSREGFISGSRAAAAFGSHMFL